METKTQGFKVRLGAFIIGGIVLFVLAIFIIGKQKNLFNPVFKVSTKFQNVSGLQVGSVVRFSGINVGTVDNIQIINDSMVKVDLLIKNDVKKFIHTDSKAGIGSEGIIGDKIIVLSQGSASTQMVKESQYIQSIEPIETDAIMRSLETTAGNAAIASSEITDIMIKINSGEGTLGRLIQDDKMASNIDQTLSNLNSGSKKLDENMEAAKHNFLLKGYFNKKKKAEEKKKKEAEKAKEDAAEKAKKEAEEKAKKSSKK
jgi:phospholipid/cholesterol/gamma-HCH transport system substrate-binding protein